MKLNDLSELSPAYREEAHIYQIFSNCEDYPQYILKSLIPLLKNQTIVDIGCGNGKYMQLLKPYVKDIIGIDKAYPQLFLAKRNYMNENLLLIQADATELPLSNNYTDIVLACWMLGTILNEEQRYKALNEMKRICKTNGSILLVENLEDSEFERLRGRSPDPLKKTANYNDYLLRNGFSLLQTINTYFKFDTQKQAQDIFSSIWKERLTTNISSNVIEHKVGIFCYHKKENNIEHNI